MSVQVEYDGQLYTVWVGKYEQPTHAACTSRCRFEQYTKTPIKMLDKRTRGQLRRLVYERIAENR